MSLEVFTGDDWNIVVTLKRDGSPLDVSTATDIKAAVVDSDGSNPQTLVSAVTLSDSATGADWANGVVVVQVPELTTSPLSPASAYLEIQVTLDGDKTTWPRNNIVIKKGTIA